MTISRKLFLITTIGLSLGAFNVSAYDVVGLKEEVQLISAFADQHDAVEYNGQTIHLKDWLNKTIDSTWMTSNSKIIKIASLIKQNNGEELLMMIEKDIRKDITIKAAALSFVVGTYIILLYETIKDDISFPLELKISHSKIETLVALDKMQQQINDLTQKVDKTWFQKLFAKA